MEGAQRALDRAGGRRGGSRNLKQLRRLARISAPTAAW